MPASVAASGEKSMVGRLPCDIPIAACSSQSCESPAQKMVKKQQNLAALSKAQNDAANRDAFGVFLIDVSVGSVAGGEKEGQVAVAEGKVQAIENAMKSKGCA